MDNPTIPRMQKHDHLGVTMFKKPDQQDVLTVHQGQNNTGFSQQDTTCCRHQCEENHIRDASAPIHGVCNCDWSPHTQKDSQNLENVQRSAAIFVCDINNYRKAIIVLPKCYPLSTGTPLCLP